MDDPVALAERILRLTRMLDGLEPGGSEAAEIRFEIHALRERAARVEERDPAELRRRLDALRAEADRIRGRRIDIVKQIGGGAAGGPGWDGPITQWLNTRMDSAAGLPEIEREIAELERLLEETP